jgi:hypothetical protein
MVPSRLRSVTERNAFSRSCSRVVAPCRVDEAVDFPPFLLNPVRCEFDGFPLQDVTLKRHSVAVQVFQTRQEAFRLFRHPVENCDVGIAPGQGTCHFAAKNARPARNRNDAVTEIVLFR